MVLSMILAAAKNGAIGMNNELLWHLPNDFKFFKQHTTGHPIIMGRKTFESIGRPLPGRTNIVISSNYEAEGVTMVKDLESAIKLAYTLSESPFIIGGASIYKQAYPVIDKIYLTVVDCEPEGDAYFDFPDMNFWQVDFEESHPADEKHKYAYTFKILSRKA